MTRLPTLWRAGVAVVALGLGIGLVTSSASTLGGLDVAPLGAARAEVASTAAVSLDWNAGVEAASFLTLRNVAVKPTDGGWQAGDRVHVTATGGSRWCAGSATAPASTAGLSVLFPDCAMALTEIDGVQAVAVKQGKAVVLKSSVGDVFGTLASYRGEVVDDKAAGTDHTLETINGVPHLATVTMSPAGRTVGNGARVHLELELKQGAVLRHIFEARDLAVDAADGAVTLDLSDLPGGRPKASAVARYSLVLVELAVLQPQVPPSVAAIVTADAVELDVVDPTEDPEPAPSGTVHEDVSVADGLSYNLTKFEYWDSDSFSFCFSFTVRNHEPVVREWEIVVDTNLAPMWGLTPGGATTRLEHLKTMSFDARSGLWTLAGGPNWIRTLPAAPPNGFSETQEMRICAFPPPPPVDPSLYEVGITPVLGSGGNSVSLLVKASSSSRWRIPWALTFDLADYVCPNAITGTIWGANGVTLQRQGSTTTYSAVLPKHLSVLFPDRPLEADIGTFQLKTPVSGPVLAADGCQP